MRNNFIIKYYDGEILSGIGAGAGAGAAIGSAVPVIGTAIGGLVGAAAGLVGGVIQHNKAKKLLAANQYVPAAIPPEALYNQQLAKQMANEGLPSQQYQQGMRNIQRQQASAIRNAADRRAGIGLIGQIQQGTNDATANLDVANANARLQNQRQLYGVNNQVAAYRNQAYDRNEAERQQQWQYGQELLGAANANILHGVDELGATFIRSGGGLFGTRMPDSGGSSNKYSPVNTGLQDSGVLSQPLSVANQYSQI